jgi:hypothetical protein
MVGNFLVSISMVKRDFFVLVATLFRLTSVIQSHPAPAGCLCYPLCGAFDQSAHFHRAGQ